MFKLLVCAIRFQNSNSALLFLEKKFKACAMDLAVDRGDGFGGPWAGLLEPIHQLGSAPPRPARGNSSTSSSSPTSHPSTDGSITKPKSLSLQWGGGGGLETGAICGSNPWRGPTGRPIRCEYPPAPSSFARLVASISIQLLCSLLSI